MDTVVLGLALGLGAGLSPGPLLAVLIASTLERGFGAGARIALAPLVTDVPIVALSVLVLQGLPGGALAALSLAGGAFVGWLAVDAVRAPAPGDRSGPGRDLRRGAFVNLLSPHPWLFWITVGGPLLVDTADRSVPVAAAFLGGFYLVLVGTKLALAGLVAAGRRTALSAWVRPVSAVLLGAAAIALVADGVGRI